MVANVAIQVKMLKSTPKPDATGARLVANAAVTVPYIGTIRDILISKRTNGELTVYGPSRPGAEGAPHRYYTVFFPAEWIIEKIKAEFKALEEATR